MSQFWCKIEKKKKKPDFNEKDENFLKVKISRDQQQSRDDLLGNRL